MRMLILGASGGCGRWLTRLAVEREHQVTLVTRQPHAAAEFAGATVIHGDVLTHGLLETAVCGQDVVLSALGIRRASRNPWSRLLSPPDFSARVAQALVPAMTTAGVTRLLTISAAGVGDSDAQLTPPVRLLLALGNVGVAYRDLAVMESVLASSQLNCTIVRPVALLDGAVTGRARPVERFALSSTIRRADVAHWMVQTAERPATSAGTHFVTLGS